MQHRLLDEYVKEVSVGLNKLPAHERVLEVEEIRQHLDTLIAANVELGATEEEATKSAISQFGNARQIGSSLRNAYLRKANPLRDTLAWATLVALATYAGTGAVGAFTWEPMMNQWFATHYTTMGPAAWWVAWVPMALMGLVVATVTHRFAPRKALPATGMVLLLPILMLFANMFAAGNSLVGLDWMGPKFSQLGTNYVMMPLWMPQWIALAGGLLMILGKKNLFKGKTHATQTA